MVAMVVIKIDKSARKQIRSVPPHVAAKLRAWMKAVHRFGMGRVRMVSGWHDEPLKGKRQGQRSIRLSRAYRAIYVIGAEGDIEIVLIREVHKHDY